MSATNEDEASTLQPGDLIKLKLVSKLDSSRRVLWSAVHKDFHIVGDIDKNDVGILITFCDRFSWHHAIVLFDGITATINRDEITHA